MKHNYSPRFSSCNYRRLIPFLDAIDATPQKHFKFTIGGEDSAMMPLSIENLGFTFNGCPVYGMMHFYTQCGDLMRDPDMTFYVDRDQQKIIPMSFQQDGGICIYQRVFDTETLYRPRLLTDLDRFLNTWSKNIIHQGYNPRQATPSQHSESKPPQSLADLLQLMQSIQNA